MWQRVVEVMLALWLAVSPFVFRHAPQDTLLWANDLTCALLVLVLALLCFWPPTRRANVGVLAVALWLLALGYLRHAGEPPPASQNHLVVGLLLLMHAMIPTDSLRPPRAWRAFHERRGDPSGAGERPEGPARRAGTGTPPG